MTPLIRSIPLMLFAVALSAVSAVAGQRIQHGLLWRDSPLAAVFPLVVKTPPGRDYFLRVERVGDGRAVLAAGITGGQFFRVLVPNGNYLLDFSYGTDWQGQDRGFAPGADSGHLRIETPLHLGVQGVARKGGHVVTLPDVGQGGGAGIKAQGVCQRLTLRWIQPGPGETRVPGVDLDGAIPVTGPHRPVGGAPLPLPPGSELPGPPYLAFGIRSVVCD